MKKLNKDELLSKLEDIRLTLCEFNERNWFYFYEQAYQQLKGLIEGEPKATKKSVEEWIKTDATSWWDAEENKIDSIMRLLKKLRV